MTPTLTIAKRELSSFFYSPIAYLVLGVFSFGAGLLFLLNFAPGQPASLRATFNGVIWLMILLAPAVSMRLLADELRTGTLELLMTAPIHDAQVVIGKWLGAMGFFIALLLPLAAMTLVLSFTSHPDYGPIISGFLGLLLVGGVYLAIGTFASSLTQNQIIAFLLTVFIICMFTLLLFFLPFAAWMPDRIRAVLLHLNVNSQFDTYAKGLVDWPILIYFVSLIGLFLFLATQTLQSKRWR